MLFLGGRYDRFNDMGKSYVFTVRWRGPLLLLLAVRKHLLQMRRHRRGSYQESPGTVGQVIGRWCGCGRKPLFGRLPFLPTVDLAGVIDPHFVIGLTEPLGTKLTDVETDGTRTIISVAAQFNADMIGKVAVLTKLDGTDSVTTTVTSYFDTDSIELNDAPAWTEEGSILIIEDSQPRGLLFDLVGLSLNSGEWHEKLRDAGHRVEIHRSWITAANVVIDYLKLPLEKIPE